MYPFIRIYIFFRKLLVVKYTLKAGFIGPTWDPSEADRTQVGPMLAPWTWYQIPPCRRARDDYTGIRIGVDLMTTFILQYEECIFVGSRDRDLLLIM